ncbi:MAG: phage tail tube protein [Clostridiales bacterium]|nr:phage tail tube protein [Clostridiales bacterium]
MEEAKTLYSDTVSGHEGKGYITIDGHNREAFELSKFTAEIELTVSEKRMLGHRMTQHKVTGAKGTGSMTMYHMNSEMINYAKKYLKNGTFTGFTMLVVQDDEGSTVGKQEIAYYGVIPTKLPGSNLDDSSDDGVTFDTDFTFDSFEILSSFDSPANL